MVLERRTIAELIARYELEPQLRDIYVEGTRDSATYGWFFKNLGCDPVSVFEIDLVEVGNDLLEKFGLSLGNRSRVVALALSMEDSLSKPAPYVKCIVDSDFDFILGGGCICNYLLYTDYTSIEIYSCTEGAIEKLFMVGMGSVPKDSRKLIENFAEILKNIFALRAANQDLEWGIGLPSIGRSLKMRGDEIELDIDGLINKYLSASGRMSKREEFLKRIETLKGKMSGDFRRFVHRDDFMELLGWYVRRVKGVSRNFANSVHVAILAAVEFDEIKKEALFSDLSGIYSEK